MRVTKRAALEYPRKQRRLSSPEASPDAYGTTHPPAHSEVATSTLPHQRAMRKRSGTVVNKSNQHAEDEEGDTGRKAHPRQMAVCHAPYSPSLGLMTW